MEQFKADDGESVDVKVMGEGSPVVFLHGWTSSAIEWLSYAEAISDRHRVFCWNARGHGGHVPSTDTEPTVQRMARDVQNLIDHYALHKPVLVGHSMGALTIWEYVLQFGCDRLSKLCIIDQSPKLRTDESWDLGIYGEFTEAHDRDFMARLEDDFPEAVLRLAAYGKNPKAAEDYESDAGVFPKWRELLQRLHPAPLINCWESLSSADYRHVLPKIDIPTLLIYGDESQFYSLETAAYVHEKIPGAVLHIYEGTDHAPHLWERERFVSALRQFLEDDHQWASSESTARQ